MAKAQTAFYNVALKKEFWEKGPSLAALFKQAHIDVSKQQPKLEQRRRVYVELTEDAEKSLRALETYLYVDKLSP